MCYNPTPNIMIRIEGQPACPREDGNERALLKIRFSLFENQYKAIRRDENEENGKKELPSVQARKERNRKLSPASFTQSQQHKIYPFLLSGWMNESAANSTPVLLHEWAEGSSLRPFLNAQNYYKSSNNQVLQLNSSIHQIIHKNMS